MVLVVLKVKELVTNQKQLLLDHIHLQETETWAQFQVVVVVKVRVELEVQVLPQPVHRVVYSLADQAVQLAAVQVTMAAVRADFHLVQ